MSDLKLNGHSVKGNAVLEANDSGRKSIWATLTVLRGSAVYQIARSAVLANDLEVTLEGQAHDPLGNVNFDFCAAGQLINGRVGLDIKADFKSTTFKKLSNHTEAEAIPISHSQP